VAAGIVQFIVYRLPRYLHRWRRLGLVTLHSVGVEVIRHTVIRCIVRKANVIITIQIVHFLPRPWIFVVKV
jgi:hypothetical protein